MSFCLGQVLVEKATIQENHSVAYLASVFVVDIWKLSELLLVGVEPALVLVLSVHVFCEVVSTGG